MIHLPPQTSIATTGLRTQYLKNPKGIDAARPRLTWYLSSSTQGDHPTAYQIQVDKGSRKLWDTGKIASVNTFAEYNGKPLNSGDRLVWRVRTWDASNNPGPWSASASWTVGLLNREDWKAEWITSPILADPANRPRTPIHCYRSELTQNPHAPKWITLDLGSVQPIDSIHLAPARPEGLTFDIGTVQFPKKFRLEAATTSDFHDSKPLVDQTKSEYPEPRSNSCEFKFPKTQARYVRLHVTELGGWDARDYGVFLGQFSVNSEDKNVAVGAIVTVSDSIESELWSKNFLVSGKSVVEFGPFPAALDPKGPEVTSPSRTCMLRRDFRINSPIRHATLTCTARGFYEPQINGERVSPDLLAPGFTDFHQRISYQTYDVTHLLRQGENTLGALLGYGWYAGHMNLAGNAYLYGYFPQLAAQLEVELANGKKLIIGTDRHWQTTLDGPVRWSDLLDGEAVDFRREDPKAQIWQPAWSQPLGSERLVAERTPPVREIQTMRPVHRTQVSPGVYVYDLGQEITGWIRLKATGSAGTHITIRHAEAQKPNGELDVASLWGTPQRDDYFLDGKGPRTLEPHFTYHGFRYFEVSGLTHPPKEDELVAVNIHTAADEVGHFECSNPLFNRLMAASKWTQRNLLFDVPAGCAARSERLAWTGDIRPCVQTALFNFDTAAFFYKYTADLRDDQKADGRFTDICPHAHLTGTDICVGSPGWADAGVSLPWDLYVNTGDRQVLENSFDSARRWVDFVHSKNPDLIWKEGRGMDWGDWLSAGPATPKEIGSTAFFAHSADLVSRMAHVLEREDEAIKYRELFNGIRQAFQTHYLSPDGMIPSGDVQGSYALALQFNLLDEPLRSKALGHLTKRIKKDGGHPTTGFWSSIEMPLALSRLGQHELASQIVNLTTAPSWGNMLAAGGTTFWEAFDANQKTLSLNHWTHSACGEWLWRDVAGLSPDPDHPGYKQFTVQPRPTREVTWCKSEYKSVRGLIKIEWKATGTRFTLDLTVPPGSTARVTLPGGKGEEVVGSGTHHFSVP